MNCYQSSRSPHPSNVAEVARLWCGGVEPESGDFGYGSGKLRLLLAAFSTFMLALTSPLEAGTITPADCFTRSDRGVCAGIEHSLAESLFGPPTTRTSASAGHPHTAAIDQTTAATVGFTTPPFGLDTAAPLSASVETSPKTSRPTDAYRIEQRGAGALDATLPDGATPEFQRANWGSTFDTQLFFSGPGSTVDVQLSYVANARMAAPRGAKDRPESGMMSLVGGLLLQESASPNTLPLVEYYGEFVFLPSHPTHPATASNQWTPEEISELTQQDTIEVDDQLEEAALSVFDELVFSAATGTSYDLDGFFTGSAGGEIYADSAQGGPLRWGTMEEAAAVIEIRVLTPGATMVAAVPIPETTAGVSLALSLAVFASRRRKVGRKKSEPPVGCSF